MLEKKRVVPFLFWTTEFYFGGGGLILTVRKFPSGSGNSRVVPEIPEWFLKFPNLLGAFRACVAYTH